MKTGTLFYKPRSKKLVSLFEEFFSDENKMRRQARNFSRSVGGHPHQFHVTHYPEYSRFSGVIFDKNPDNNLWKRIKTAHPYLGGKRVFVGSPKKNTKRGKALHGKFSSVIRPTLVPFLEAINWKDDIYSSGGQSYITCFNFFATADRKFYGFTVPEINGEPLKGLNLKGCQKISYKTYAKYMGD